jgi:sugar transferase EpsL
MNRKFGLAIKRGLDIVGSLILLVALSPFMLTTAALVALKHGRPIIHYSKRVSQYAGVFRAYKFKTMLDIRGPDGKYLPDEQRLTRLGNFLRTTSLDELPQLFNIIKGEMSLIGPRPILTEYLPYLDEKELLRLQMKPGITGLAQVNGRNSLEWDKRLEMDVWYVGNWSLWLDIKVALKTIPVWFFAKGINSPGLASSLRLDDLRIREGQKPGKPAALRQREQAQTGTDMSEKKQVPELTGT